MPESTVPVVLFGRFSAVSGQSSFATLPVNVVAYETAMIHVWRGKIAATSTFAFSLQESNDQTVWTTLASGDPGAEMESLMTATLTKAWLRATVALTDATEVPVATCYAFGDLVLRRGPGGGGAQRAPTSTPDLASGGIRPPGS